MTSQEQFYFDIIIDFNIKTYGLDKDEENLSYYSNNQTSVYLENNILFLETPASAGCMRKISYVLNSNKTAILYEDNIWEKSTMSSATPNEKIYTLTEL